MKIGCIVVAAGRAERFGAKKQFAELKGRQVIDYSIDVLRQMCSDVAIVVTKDDESFIRRRFPFAKVVIGGQERMNSVYNGLNAVVCDIVLIHDAARPLIDKMLVERIIKTAKQYNSAVPIVNIVETVKKTNISSDLIEGTISRDCLYTAQTPQAFDYIMLKRIYDRIIDEGIKYTDESGIWEKFYGTSKAVKGERRNIKITAKEDLEFVKCLLG